MSGGGGSSSDSNSTSSYDEAGTQTTTAQMDADVNTSDISDSSFRDSTGDYRNDGTGYNPYASPTSTTAGKEFYSSTDGRYDKNVMESGGTVYSNYSDNLKRTFDQQFNQKGFGGIVNKAAYILNPIGKATATAAQAAAQTLAANYALGNIKSPALDFFNQQSNVNRGFNPNVSPSSITAGQSFSEMTSGGPIYSTTTNVGTNNNQASGVITAPNVPINTLSGVPIQSPAGTYFANQGTTNTQSSFLTEYEAARIKQQGLLSTGSPIGLLAVNDSPFYDFLKLKNLNRRVL